MTGHKGSPVPVVYVTNKFVILKCWKGDNRFVKEIAIGTFAVFVITIEIIVGLVITKEIPILTTWPK